MEDVMEDDKVVLNKKGDYRIGPWRCNKNCKLTHVYDMFGHKWTIEEALEGGLIRDNNKEKTTCKNIILEQEKKI